MVQTRSRARAGGQEETMPPDEEVIPNDNRSRARTPLDADSDIHPPNLTSGTASTMTSNFDSKKLITFSNEDKLGRDTKNYQAWRKIMEGIFDLNNCMEIVEGTKEMPKNKGIEKQEWKSLQGYAFTQIMMGLDRAFLVGLDEPPRNLNRACHLWKQIIKLKDKSTEVHQMLAADKISNCKMREGGNIITHMERLRQLRKEAEECGYSIEEPHWKLVFFRSLPPSWHTFIDGNMYKTDVEEIMANAEIRYEFNKMLPYNTAHSNTASYCNYAMQSETSRNKNLYCTNCQYTNHKFKDCRRPGGEVFGHNQISQETAL